MSLTYIAVIVQLLSLFGIRVDPEALSTTICTIVGIVSGLVAFYGRWRAGGITWWGRRVGR